AAGRSRIRLLKTSTALSWQVREPRLRRPIETVDVRPDAARGDESRELSRSAYAANPTHRRYDMLLEGKNAVIYGAGGSIGGAVARAFAREGAAGYLAGRALQSLEKVAHQVRAAGGAADTARLDALDEHQVDAHAEAVPAKAGSIDISVNLISQGD